MNVLVVGGKGYIGSVLVPQLISDGHAVSVFDDMTGRTGPQHCEGVDALIYLAGLTNNDDCERFKILNYAINHQALEWAVQMADFCKVKHFIYASSAAVYGSSDRKAKEDGSLGGTTAYASGKRYCESIITRIRGMAWTITRAASVCGLSPVMRYHLTLTKMVRDAKQTGVITVNGGAQMRSHIHIQDICRFYRLLLTALREKTVNQTFNVVCENQSIIDTARLVAKITGASIVEQPYTDNRSYSISGEKTKRILGFECQHTLKEAVREMYEKL